MTKDTEGAIWKIVSCACFAGINGIVRYCSGGISDSSIEPLPANVIMFFQNVFGALFLLPWILKSGFKCLKTCYPILHLVRIIISVLGIYMWYLSLKLMPIAEVVALNFTGPIFTVIGATLLLKERISLRRLCAIILSLIGIFIISCHDTQFYGDNHSIGFAALLPLSSALAFAFNKLLTRKLANLGETPISLAMYLLLFSVPVSLLSAVYECSIPSVIHWSWLALLGLLAAGAQLSLSKAYQLAEVSSLVPIGTIRFFLSILVGYLAFSELPTTWSSWIGIIAIFSSIFVALCRVTRPC